MRVLIVEDDKIIGDGLVQGLTLEGYAVDWVQNRQDAESAFDSQTYDLAVIDIGLPDGSGLDVVKHLRTNRNPIPVLILTAYDGVNYKVRGLDVGADDYLIKPFDLNELAARLRALRRRAEGNASPVLNRAGVTLDPASHKVMKDGQAVDLGPKEFAILNILMSRDGRVLSKTQIEESLYGWNAEVESNTVEVHIHGLRKKLGKDIIETIRHVGYRMAGEKQAS